MTFKGERDRHGRMIRIAEHNRGAALGKAGDEAPGPGDAVGMHDYRMNIVERDAPDLLAILFDHQEAAVSRKVQPIAGNVDDAIHPPSRYSRGPGSKTRPSGSTRT